MIRCDRALPGTGASPPCTHSPATKKRMTPITPAAAHLFRCTLPVHAPCGPRCVATLLLNPLLRIRYAARDMLRPYRCARHLRRSLVPVVFHLPCCSRDIAPVVLRSSCCVRHVPSVMLHLFCRVHRATPINSGPCYRARQVASATLRLSCRTYHVVPEVLLPLCATYRGPLTTLHPSCRARHDYFPRNSHQA